jgi:transposase
VTQTKRPPANPARFTTKILALVDALGNLARFALMPGQRGEITCAKKLIEGPPLGTLLPDKAYDADHLRDLLKSKGVEPVIPARKGRLSPATHDARMYKWAQGVRTDRHESPQNRHDLQSHDKPCGDHDTDEVTVNVNSL